MRFSGLFSFTGVFWKKLYTHLDQQETKDGQANTRHQFHYCGLDPEVEIVDDLVKFCVLLEFDHPCGLDCAVGTRGFFGSLQHKQSTV